MLISIEDAMDQAVRLDRTIGYQREPEALNRLVDGLVNACNRHGIAPDRIVSRCLELSQYCPTDHDLFEQARQLREAEASPMKTWQQTKQITCSKCSDTGWEQISNGNVTGVKRCSCGASVKGQYDEIAGAVR